MYHVHQMEIVFQSYIPWKLKHQFTQTGPIVLVLHLLGLGFWMFRVFYCFLTINRASSLVVTQFRGRYPPHLFSEISYQRPSYFISILYVSYLMKYLICLQREDISNSSNLTSNYQEDNFVLIYHPSKFST